MKHASALLLASALCLTGQATAQGSAAATLQDLNGKVLVNKGNGLVVSGKTGTALVNGDRIFTLDKSGARIVFADGCAVTLDENKLFVINAELGCKATPVSSKAAAAAPGGLTIVQGGLISAAVLGGVAAAASGASNNNDKRPISNQ
jgi:hypothetical protein